MKLQISSGQGPSECQLGVKKLFDSLKKEFVDIKLISSNKGPKKDCYTSIIFETNEDLSFLEGSILWICQSPIRKNHKRKNWFIDVSILKEEKLIDNDQIYKVQTMHSGGKGGQNVNKVETGVRVTHIPTGIVVVCTEERSQYLNKQKAIENINKELEKRNKEIFDSNNNNAWKEHNRLIRGNPIRTYKDLDFKLIK